MSIVGGFDVHRQQITFDYVDTDTGQLHRGQVRPATRLMLRRWLTQRLAGRSDVAFAVEGCTGWRFVAEELARAGVEVHLAEPADTATLRGRKKRAKTDRADARLLRELLDQGRLPESWVPPVQVLEIRTLGRLYCALMDQRRAWQQRIHAQLYHQGVPPVRGLLTGAGWAALAEADLSPAGRQMVDTALVAIDGLTELITPLRTQLVGFARRQAGCRALQRLYVVGWLCAAIIWAELGDCRRFADSDAAVRYTGLDITVYSSDGKRSPGHLARQGSQELRWALFEAAKSASRRSSPDYGYYTAVAERCGGKRPTLSVGSPQVDPPRPPHPAGTGRHGVCRGGAGGGGLMYPVRALAHESDDVRGPLPPFPCRRRYPWAAVPKRTSGRAPSPGSPHRPSRAGPARGPRTQIRLGAGAHLIDRHRQGAIVHRRQS